MNKSRLPQADKPAVLQKVQKDMAAFGRSLQCSLAIADMAKHIGGANLKDSLTKEQLKELVQVLGTLGTEAALPILPKFERQVSLFKAEKTRLREGVIAGIEPHEVQALLRDAPLFSEGLWPKSSFMEAEKLALERQQVSRFPAEERAISLKRAATISAGLPSQKRVRLDLPPNPVYSTGNRRVFTSQGKAARTPSPGAQGQGRAFRAPALPVQPKAHQPKAQQPKALLARAQQPKAEQSGQRNKALALASTSKVNFKKPKLNVIPKPFVPPASSSGSNPGTSSAPRKR